MNDSAYMKQLFSIDSEAKEKYIEKIYKAYLDNKVKIGDGLFILCLQDPILYGNMVKRIQDHKKSVAQQNGQAENSATEIQDRTEPLRQDRDISGEQPRGE